MVFVSNYPVSWQLLMDTGPILESKGMRAIFQKKGKKGAKYWKTWARMYKIWKYLEKGQPHACNYRTHETARICPGILYLVIL